MKISEFRKIIREEVRKAVDEAMVTDTLKVVIGVDAKGTGTFYKASIFEGPYKANRTFNIKAVSTGNPTNELTVIPNTSLKSFVFDLWLVPGEEDELYNRVVKMIEDFFKSTQNDIVTYKDGANMSVTFQGANELKNITLTTLKNNWKPTWAAKSPKFNLG